MNSADRWGRVLIAVAAVIAAAAGLAVGAVVWGALEAMHGSAQSAAACAPPKSHRVGGTR